ncbi:MAG: hypothetical protein WCP85_17190 [Mariniphaga sp.]
MGHHSSETTMSHTETVFMDLMRHGDDFFKIELLRPAKAWYKKALELNIQTENVKQKIAECDRLIAYEVKVIKILAVVGTLVILALIIFH